MQELQQTLHVSCADMQSLTAAVAAERRTPPVSPYLAATRPRPPTEAELCCRVFKYAGWERASGPTVCSYTQSIQRRFDFTVRSFFKKRSLNYHSERKKTSWLHKQVESKTDLTFLCRFCFPFFFFFSRLMSNSVCVCVCV